MLAFLGVLAPILDRILGAVLPDPAARQKAIMDALGKLQDSDIEQLKVNAAEASHASIFVAGWRPFIGWVCGVALAYQYVAVPIIMWVGYWVGHPIPKPPTLDDALWELMMGMLGMGALRSLEKIKGVAGK